MSVTDVGSLSLRSSDCCTAGDYADVGRTDAINRYITYFMTTIKRRWCRDLIHLEELEQGLR